MASPSSSLSQSILLREDMAAREELERENFNLKMKLTSVEERLARFVNGQAIVDQEQVDQLMQNLRDTQEALYEQKELAREAKRAAYHAQRELDRVRAKQEKSEKLSNSYENLVQDKTDLQEELQKLLKVNHELQASRDEWKRKYEDQVLVENDLKQVTEDRDEWKRTSEEHLRNLRLTEEKYTADIEELQTKHQTKVQSIQSKLDDATSTLTRTERRNKELEQEYKERLDQVISSSNDLFVDLKRHKREKEEYKVGLKSSMRERKDLLRELEKYKKAYQERREEKKTRGKSIEGLKDQLKRHLEETKYMHEEVYHRWVDAGFPNRDVSKDYVTHNQMSAFRDAGDRCQNHVEKLDRLAA